MYKIGELSKLSKIPVKTIRFYDREGLLPPDEIDPYTSYRYYSAQKLRDCYRILALKELGFTLEEIKSQSTMSKDELFSLLASKEQELNEQAAKLSQHIKNLRQLKSALEEDNSMYNIVVKKDSGFTAAYRRAIITDKSRIPEILDEMKLCLPEKIRGGRIAVIDYETEYQSDTFDIGFGIEIAPKLSSAAKSALAENGLEEKEICFSHETASLVCGLHETDSAVLALHRFIQEYSYQIIGAVYEIIYEDQTVELKIPVWKLGAKRLTPKADNLDLPFENDERVIGKWLLVDALPSREQFHPKKPKTASGRRLSDELYFLPGGERYWIYGWTKGYLFTTCGYPSRKGANPYTIEDICGETYLFVEQKTDWYFYHDGLPEVWVYKKMDSKKYTRKEIMIKDEIPDLPADDPDVLGLWEACGFSSSPEDFQPNDAPDPDLFWVSAQFLENGGMRNSFQRENGLQTDMETSGIWRWVRGGVICNPKSTVSAYCIKEYAQTKYLFIQWKSGDYSFGGTCFGWYVFRRQN